MAKRVFFDVATQRINLLKVVFFFGCGVKAAWNASKVYLLSA